MPNGKGSIYLELIVLASGSSSLIWPKICMAWCPLWSQNVLKLLIWNSYWLQNVCKGFCTPHWEKELPNVNRTSNYQNYIHKSTKFSAPITKLIIITLLNESVKRPGLCSSHSNSCMFGSDSARKSGSYQLYLIILSMVKW